MCTYVCMERLRRTDDGASLSPSLPFPLFSTSPMAVEASHLLFRTEICISVSARRGEGKDVQGKKVLLNLEEKS